VRYAGAVQADEVSELLRPYLGSEELDEPLLRDILTYIDLLQRWNARTNLTAVRDPRRIVTRHFGESFFLARHLLTRDSAEEVIDVGSGPGFPGIPLKLYARGIRLSLIESQGKKAIFLREVVRALGLAAVEVLNVRSESCTAKARLVTLRAVEKIEKALPAARDLVAEGGRLALLTSRQRFAAAKEALGVQWEVLDVPTAPDSAAEHGEGGGVLAIYRCG